MAPGTLQLLLPFNEAWSTEIKKTHPTLLHDLSKTQHPKILWLGCADSRVPETTLLNLLPGDVFTHRNIANVLPPTDISSTAVISYAVTHLKVELVIVCGHSGCGGVAAALGEESVGGVLDAWLLPLRGLRAQLEKGWEERGAGREERVRDLVEANVREGVRSVRERGEVQARGPVGKGGVRVVGCVFEIGEGRLRVLDDGEGGEGVREAFVVK